MIWCVCDFYFFLYQTMFQRFKKMNIVKIIWWMNWLTRKQKNRLLTKCRKFEEKNRQLTVVVTNSLIDWKNVMFRDHFQKNFTFWRFSFKHSRIFTSDENFVFTRSFYEQLTIFFNYSRISTSISDDFI